MVEIVFLRPRLVVLDGQLDGDPDVEDRTRQQNQALDPQHRPEALQKVGVAVDLVGRREDLEVADEVTGDEDNEHRTGDGHDELLADRSAKKTADGIHRKKGGNMHRTGFARTIRRNSSVGRPKRGGK